MAGGHIQASPSGDPSSHLPGDIHKLTNGLPQLPHAFGQRAEVRIPWQIALFCPVLEALPIGYCEKGRLPPYILVGKVVWEVGPSAQTSGGWRCRVPFFWEHPRPDFWYIKRCPDLLSKFTPVGDAWNSF